MATVELQGITRRFEGVTAIENITLAIPDGEFWVLVGPSGCGKSTILRTIAGLESVTEGKLFIDGYLMNEVPARARDVAMVFQNYALYPHMTVAENLAFGLQMRKVEGGVIQDRVEKVAKALDIFHLLNRKPKQLSGGQQQRVALGRAIAREPKVFLLDEPLSNLDAQLRDDTRAELKQLHQRVGITTIYVTHDQVEAMTLGDRIVVLDRGCIQQIDEPQAIYTRPANRMVATFIGTPPMNIIRAIYTEGRFKIGNQFLPCPSIIQNQLQLKEGQAFDLGIRPEHLSIAKESEASLTATISVIEPLGREILLRCTLPETGMILNVQAPFDWRGKIGDRLPLQLDSSHLFIFDSTTGETLFSINP